MLSSNQFVYSRERRRFGRQPLFSDRNQYILSINPSSRLRLSYILRNPINRSTQLSDQKAASTMETENVTYTEHGLYHYEGGWPREVNINDEESTLRHRKKIEREDTWAAQVPHQIQVATHLADQNSAVNIYEEFFADLPPELCPTLRSRFESNIVVIFHDPAIPHRMTRILEWTPNNNNFMAMYTSMEKGQKPTAELHNVSKFGSKNAFYIWDLQNTLKPLTIFEAVEPVRKVIFCPKDENFYAGGFASGKTALWDARTGGMPVRISPLEAAHREDVSAVVWVHSKSNTEFYTGSYDGSIKYWDGRDLKEPYQEVLLDPEHTDEQSRERAHGVSVLEFEYTIPVRYIVASAHGCIFIGNRKGVLPSEVLVANYRLFSGPIRTIERNPFFVKNFLITGDWCAKVWAEECKGAPNTLLVKKKTQITCGSWSTMRCSLFATGDANGELDFWDLLLHQRKPILSFQFTSPIKYVKFRSDGEYLAVATANGDVNIMSLDPSMKHSAAKDKQLIAALFEREQLRSKLLEGRVEEMKLKRRTVFAEEEDGEEEEVEASKSIHDSENSEEFLEMIEGDEEFKEALNSFNEVTDKVDIKRTTREFLMEPTEFETYVPPEIEITKGSIDIDGSPKQ